jgi:hypothetical protein
VATNRPDDEREARIDVILEELRLNTQDLHELAAQAAVRARETRRRVRATADSVRAQQRSQGSRKAEKKR